MTARHNIALLEPSRDTQAGIAGHLMAGSG
jgi:hypothetical protein